MRIGILTYSRALNYGALLQAFALKTYIQKGRDVNVEIVDYWPDYHDEAYRLFSFKLFYKLSILSKLKYIFGFLLGLNRNLNRRAKYFEFIENKLKLTGDRKYRTGSEETPVYDLVVYGSDQIWRKHPYRFFSDFDKVYFGSFPGNAKRKITYAASMGILCSSNEDIVKLKNWLPNFDALSIRERNLNDLVNQLGFHSKLVLDPVFLLTKEEWKANLKISPPSSIKSKYILLFLLSPSEDAIVLADKIKGLLGYEVKIVNRKVMPFEFGEQYMQTASTEEFLGLINDAEFVISTSFHGTAFSVLFEKQFFSLGMGENSERSRTILSLLGIENRYLDSINAYDTFSDIDYVAVKEKLSELVAGSKGFLDEQITSLYVK